VSDIHTVSRSSGHIESTPIHVFAARFSNLKPLHSIWTKTTILTFSFRQFVLFTLACLTVATFGCGSGGVDPAASSVMLSPGSVDFGDVPVGQEVDSSVNIVNNGAVSAVVSQVSVAGQTFSVAGQGNFPIKRSKSWLYAGLHHRLFRTVGGDGCVCKADGADCDTRSRSE
jgi:hypothetical protein